MTFRQLQAFLLVVRTGTIASASEHMGLTQSGVSRLITELSRNVGFELFTRVGRGVRPTAQGKAFFKIAEGVYDNAENLQRAAADIREGIEDRVRLACLPTIGAALLPEVLELFHRKYPNVFVEVHDQRGIETVDGFADHKLDVAVTHKLGAAEGIHTEPFAKAHYILAVHKDHALAKLETVEGKDIAGHDHMGFESDTMFLPSNDEARIFGKGPRGINKRIWCRSSFLRYSLLANKRNVNIGEPFSFPLFAPQGVVARKFSTAVEIELEFALLMEYLDSPIYQDLLNYFRQATQSFARKHDLPIFISS